MASWTITWITKVRNMDESEFEYLWTSEKDNWVLVRIPDDPNDPMSQAVWKFFRRRMAQLGRSDEPPLNCLICNRTNGGTLIIDDDELSIKVKQRMLEAGVSVVDEFPEPMPR